MFASVILAAMPVVLSPFLITPPSTSQCVFDRMGNPVREELVRTAFSAAVGRYVDLHRRLERPIPHQWFLSDFEQMEIAALGLAAAIRDARPNAGAGNIFTAEVAGVFRFRIRNNLRDHHNDPATIVSSMDEEGWIDPKPIAVNQPFPWGVANSIWPSVLRTLPALPEELEYRFVDRDLVLLDVHANLVVDILALALPAQ